MPDEPGAPRPVLLPGFFMETGGGGHDADRRSGRFSGLARASSSFFRRGNSLTPPTKRAGADGNAVNLRQDTVLRSGALSKQNRMRVWQPRWMVLEPQYLSYYEMGKARPVVAKGTVEAVGRPKGVILLADCVARTIASGGADFELQAPTRSYKLRAADDADRHEWVRLINQAASRARAGQPASSVLEEGDADDSDDDDAAPTPRGAADGGTAAVLADGCAEAFGREGLAVLHEGWLEKLGAERLNMRWRRRWCVLAERVGAAADGTPPASPTAGVEGEQSLYYLVAPGMPPGSCKGKIELAHVTSVDTLAPADDSAASDGGASGPLAAVAAAAASAAADGASGAGGGSLSPVELSFLATKSESYGTLDAVDAPAPATAGGRHGSVMAAIGGAAAGGRHTSIASGAGGSATIRVVTAKRVWRLRAATAPDHAAWVQALQQCIASVTEPASAKEASDPSSGWTPLGRSSIVAGLTGAARKGSARKGSAAG